MPASVPVGPSVGNVHGRLGVAAPGNDGCVLGIASLILRRLGVGAEGRVRFMMVVGIVIGLVGIVIGVVRGRASDLVVGVVVLVSSVVVWPWLLRMGRRRGTV
jgi:hypothetical protein